LKVSKKRRDDWEKKKRKKKELTERSGKPKEKRKLA